MWPYVVLSPRIVQMHETRYYEFTKNDPLNSSFVATIDNGSPHLNSASGRKEGWQYVLASLPKLAVSVEIATQPTAADN